MRLQMRAPGINVLGMFDPTIIYTHADGTPIAGRPDDIRDPRQVAVYEQNVRNVANAAFAKQFRKAVRR